MGFETKKSNETPYAKDFQENVLRMVASGQSEEEVTTYSKDKFKSLRSGSVDPELILKRSRLKRTLDDYKVVAGGVAGVFYYNHVIKKASRDEHISVGDSFIYYRVDNNTVTNFPRTFEVIFGNTRRVKYIAAPSLDLIINDFKPDWQTIAQAEIIKKIDLIYSSMKWNIGDVMNDGKQSSLTDWW